MEQMHCKYIPLVSLCSPLKSVLDSLLQRVQSSSVEYALGGSLPFVIICPFLH